MSDQRLGVAVIGTGFGQQIHIPALQIYPQTEVIGVYHRDLEKARSISHNHQIPHAFDDLTKLLSHPDIDAVTLSTPPFLHYDMAQEIIKAGKHLFLEKPIALNATEAKNLYTLAREKKVQITPNFEFRYVPHWQYLKEYLEQQKVGAIRYVKIDWLVASRSNPNRPWNWYAQKELGGGVLGAIGSHAFDYISWLFPPIIGLYGELHCSIKQRPDLSENGRLKPVTADDTALILLNLEGEIPCQVNLSSVTYQGRGHWIEIYGDQGTLVLGSDNLKDYVHGFRLWYAPAGEALQELIIPDRLSFDQVYPDGRLAPVIRTLGAWVTAITDKQDSTPSMRDGVYSQLLMDLTHQSHQERRWLSIPQLD